MIATFMPLAVEDFFSKLRADCQRTQPTSSPVYGSGSYLVATRQLTREEYEQIWSYVRDLSLVVDLTEGHNSGFDFAVVIYKHPESRGEELETMFELLNDNIPTEIAQAWINAPNYDRRMDKKIQLFKPLIWNQKNLKLLSFYGIELNDPSQYRY